MTDNINKILSPILSKIVFYNTGSESLNNNSLSPDYFPKPRGKTRFL